MREFLSWTLSEVHPLAEALGFLEAIGPLEEMAAGAPNTAEQIRLRLKSELGGTDEVPTALLKFLAEQRENQVSQDVEGIAASCLESSTETSRLCEFLRHAQDNLRGGEQERIPFRPRPPAAIEISYPDKTSEIIDLAEQLIRIPSVTACPDERLDEVHRAAALVYDYLGNHGLAARMLDQGKYPAVLATFPGLTSVPVMLCGHIDVVPPEPDDTQFDPRIEGTTCGVVVLRI